MGNGSEKYDGYHVAQKSKWTRTTYDSVSFLSINTASVPQVILACLAAVAIAAPQFQQDRPFIRVLTYNSADDGNGNFNYEYEAENGIYKSVQGTPGSRGQSNMRGVFR